MPWQSIPTKTDGEILSASYLNLLSANQEFLYALANQANVPFASQRTTTNLFDASTMRWWGKHRLRYFHFKVATVANWNFARLYFNGVKIAAQEANVNEFTGYYDLSSWANLPNYLGAWASGVSYDDSEQGDGEVVSQGGQFYRCKLSHTSDAGNQPGVGGSWSTYWDLLTLPAVGSIFTAWWVVDLPSSTQVTVEYMFETDSTSL